MPKILLIDDDADLTAMLSEFLMGEGFEIATAYCGREGFLAARDPTLDAVVLDIMMPDLSGIEVLRRIRAVSSVPVVMLTAKGSEDERATGFEIGADDYIPKPYYPREFLARINAVLRRRPGYTSPHPRELGIGPLRLISSKREVWYGDRRVEMTACEFNLLEALMASGDDVATKSELSLQILKRRHNHFDRSIDVHVSNLRKKLNTLDGCRIEIETVRAVGYRIRIRE